MLQAEKSLLVLGGFWCTQEGGAARRGCWRGGDCGRRRVRRGRGMILGVSFHLLTDGFGRIRVNKWCIVPSALLAGLGLSLSTGAATDHGDKARREDITRHRAMVAAHENAAKCLESGKSGEVCEKALQAACKGLAIGKNCGMKHEH